MSIQSIMNKQKLMVDDIITGVLIIIYILLAIAFRLFLLMSLIVYPMASLLIYGISGTYKGIFNKELNFINKVLNFIFGIVFILFAIFMLILLFTPPRIPISYIIYFLSIPLLLIGLAGFLKGLIVDVYSPSLKILNMIIGVITIITTFIAILFAEASFIFYLCSLLIAIALNGVLRSALYLSEYGLSLKSFRNFKLVFIIMESINVITTDNN